MIKPFLKKGKIERKVALDTINNLKEEARKEVQQAKAERIRETLSKMEGDKGEFSVDKFWKLKKAISQKTEERTTVINENGVELFDKRSILEEFKNEFKERLSHRKIARFTKVLKIRLTVW